MYSYTHTIKLPSLLVNPQSAAPPNKEDRGEPALPWYADQALPFDITLACANEYGAAASAKLFGVEILNEGFGTSIDDTVIEQQGTFVARDIAPLQAVGTTSLIGSTGSYFARIRYASDLRNFAGKYPVPRPCGAFRHHRESLPLSAAEEQAAR